MFKTCITGFLLFIFQCCFAQQRVSSKEAKGFRALVLFENKGHHVQFTDTARIWLNRFAKKKHITLDYITNTDAIDENFLKKYQLLIQLDYVPYGWKEEAQQAFIKYMEEGWGGWVGLHHASLVGDFDGYKMWPWYYDFMGGIQFKNYIPEFATATVQVEDASHPVMKGLPKTFTIEKEEWYIYDKSPRPKLRVLATVDESTYVPGTPVKMGDHPVIWTNSNVKAENVYIFMGHSPRLFLNKNFVRLFENAIIWASQK
ncbi:MAG: ThuA domain-containing protein [Agriterribacter sp.]